MQVRFYPRDAKLDNTFAQVERVPSQIMLLTSFRDILVVLCADCHVMLFRLYRKDDLSCELSLFNRDCIF